MQAICLTDVCDELIEKGKGTGKIYLQTSEKDFRREEKNGTSARTRFLFFFFAAKNFLIRGSAVGVRVTLAL